MKRHSRAEISVALNQARDMMRRGESQSAICKALGISVMTLHRWRKGFAESSGNSANVENLPGRGEAEVQIAELRVENQRLRRIVTDLLLEKAKVEEAIAQRKARA